MKRFVLLDTTPIPDNGGALCLFEYGEDFVIKIQGGDGGQLMNTRMHGSEDALAEIPCRKVAGRPGSRVLIGGLGMGFTLASALKHLGKTAEVVVAELVPGVVEWNRGPLDEKSGRPLLDPRTVIRMEDVANVLQAEPQGFDAIMLDVDNGPEGLTQKANSWLYSAGGLAGVRKGPCAPKACWQCGRPAPTSCSATNCARPVSRPRKCRCLPTATRAPGIPSGLPKSSRAEPRFPCGSWPACDGFNSVRRIHRGDSIAGKPAPTFWVPVSYGLCGN